MIINRVSSVETIPIELIDDINDSLNDIENDLILYTKLSIPLTRIIPIISEGVKDERFNDYVDIVEKWCSTNSFKTIVYNYVNTTENYSSFSILYDNNTYTFGSGQISNLNLKITVYNYSLLIEVVVNNVHYMRCVPITKNLDGRIDIFFGTNSIFSDTVVISTSKINCIVNPTRPVNL